MAADGIIIINKPLGRTSRWATTQLGRLLREKKAGHLGTLDPRADGVLPVALGQATRLVRFLEDGPKQYRGVIRLGITTDTQDAAGEILAETDWTGVTPQAATAAAKEFVGEIEQVPPMYSALKKDGRTLYKLARQGIEVEREPRRITIFSLEVEAVSLPDITVRVRCSPGTYLRTLAVDIGGRLGCGAHLAALTRLASGRFTLDQAVDLEGLDEDRARAALIAPADCLPQFPAVELTAREAALVRDGIVVIAPNDQPDFGPEGLTRLLYQGRLLAVARAVPAGDEVILRPLRVLP